jgi:hypothetical protein
LRSAAYTRLNVSFPRHRVVTALLVAAGGATFAQSVAGVAAVDRTLQRAAPAKTAPQTPGSDVPVRGWDCHHRVPADWPA